MSDGMFALQKHFLGIENDALDAFHRTRHFGPFQQFLRINIRDEGRYEHLGRGDADVQVDHLFPG